MGTRQILKDYEKGVISDTEMSFLLRTHHHWTPDEINNVILEEERIRVGCTECGFKPTCQVGWSHEYFDLSHDGWWKSTEGWWCSVCYRFAPDFDVRPYPGFVSVKNLQMLPPQISKLQRTPAPPVLEKTELEPPSGITIFWIMTSMMAVLVAFLVTVFFLLM